MDFDCLNLSDVVGFNWDDGNIYKNEKKHGLKRQEIEEVFFNEPLLIKEDFKHSLNEERCFALGITNNGKRVYVVFTKRGEFIRVISARLMNKKERLFMRELKKIPKFNSEQEEREFWETHDSTEYLDWSKAKKVTFPNLKKSTKTISLRLPADMLDRLKVKANAMDVPYQSLIKMILQKELSS